MILYIAMSLHLLPYQFHHHFGGQGTLHQHNSWGSKPLPSGRGIAQPPLPKPWGRSKQSRDHGHGGMAVTPLCGRRMRPRGNTAQPLLGSRAQADAGQVPAKAMLRKYGKYMLLRMHQCIASK